MTYTEAKTIADSIVERLRPFCLRVEIAGSVRRHKMSDIKDIEIVAVPSLASGAVLKEIVNTEWGVPIAGPFPSRYTKVRGRYNIDFFWVTRESWGLQLFLRTGPAEYSHMALGWWKRITNGGYSNEGILHLADGSVVPTMEESAVFAAFEVYGGRRFPFVPPEDRIVFRPPGVGRWDVVTC